MKKIGFIFSFLFFNQAVHAQDNIPYYGKIDKADLEMKDCSFDPGAEAVVLLDIGEMQYAYTYHVGWLLEAEYRVRIKILKENALRMANVKIEFNNRESAEDLTGLMGITYNLDKEGNITESKLEKKDKYKKGVDDVKSAVSFAMPDVKVGSVIEYRYKVSVSAFGYFPSWKFQQHIPVKYSGYRVVLPENFQYSVQTITRQPLEKKKSKSGGTWYIMRNIPGLGEEPLSSGAGNYLQRIEFQLSKIDVPGYLYENTWLKIITRLQANENFGGILKKNITMDKYLAEKVSTEVTVREKIRLIYNYVQHDMLWNEDNALMPDNIYTFSDARDKKTGNIADINFTLIKLLQKAGIAAKPLMVSTKKNGAINVNYPSMNQFNAVMAYVRDGDERYIMNAANNTNPFNLVPPDVVYTNGLLVDEEIGGLIGLNNNKNSHNDIYFTVQAEMDGTISGNATLTSSNYARNAWIEKYKNRKLKALLEDNAGISIEVDSIAVKNEKEELKPFIQELQFSGNMQTSGAYYFLPLNIFSALGKNPFTNESRLTDIDLNFPAQYVFSGSYILADSFLVDELPKNKKMLLPDSGIILTRMIQQEKNIISFRFALDFNTALYPADAYPMIKDFYKKMYAILDERIVLKKK